MKYNRKLILKTLSTLTIATPVVFVVSCGSKTAPTNLYKGILKYSSEIQNIVFDKGEQFFKLEDLDGISIYDATIKNWVDGDTPTVEFKKEIKNQTKWNIRINAIDTPEIHYKKDNDEWVDTTGREFYWADKARKFADSEMPPGTEIKIATNGEKSYNRLVGSIFYRKKDDPVNQYKSHSVEILKKGLALPFFNDIVTVVDKGSILNVTGIAMADAYNYAVKNLKGVFSEDLGKILVHHGTTSDSNIRYRIGGRGDDETPNIYEVQGVKNETK